MATEFGTLLHQYRTAAGLNKTELSRIADCDNSYIGLLERGKISHPARQAVLTFAQVFGLNASETDRLLFSSGHAPEMDYQALWEREHGSVYDRQKWCPRCERSLPAGPNGHFSTDRSRRDGLFPYCRSCKSAAWTAYSTKVALRALGRRAS